MQSLVAACEEAEKILEKVKICPLPLSRPQDFQENYLDSFETISKPTFCIFTKLYELHKEECNKDSDVQNILKSNSSLLEKLVSRERLNTLILNLYPDRNEYSFALRMGSIVDDLNIGNNLHSKASNSLSDDDVKKISWLPDDELLRHIDNEELPCFLLDILEDNHPELFYSGCIIVEVRDYQETNSQVLCETHHVLLKPSMQSLWADMNSLIDKSEHEWTDDEKLELESELTSIITPTLCLDPSPSVCIATNKLQHHKQLFNTLAIQKRVHKLSLLNRKRKLELQTPTQGLELHDFILKKRLKSTKNSASLSPKSKIPKMLLPAPSLDTKKPLTVPKNDLDEKKFRCYTANRETNNYMPHLIEEYFLDMDRHCVRDKKKMHHLRIKLSIFQRPVNSEYLGEIYLDVNYEEGKSSGASSRFTLGSRAYVDKFIRQFTDVLTEKGSKSMKIMKKVPGQEPRYICITGMNDRDNKAGEEAQATQVPASQQAVQAAHIQGNQVQVISGTSTLTNRNATPRVVMVQGNQTPSHNSTSSLPILQAQLQSNSQSKIEASHSDNPEITAIVASFISTAQKIEQEAAANAAAKSSTPSSGNNAALLSLLNTSPVNSVNSATSAAVANAITNSNSGLGSVVGIASQQTLQTINQKVLGRKMTIANVPRVLNHSNVITVNNNNVTGNAVVSVPQQVRISALASQLASPPVNVIIATANTSQQQQGQTFTLTTVSGPGFPSHLSYTTVPLNSVNTKPLNQTTRLMAAGMSSIGVRGLAKASNSDGMSVSGLSALLVNTPSADHPIPGANTASALLERLTASSSSSPVPADSSTQFTMQNSKTLQQIPVQLTKNNPVITPMASPPGQQTLNVHTLNLAPFQGTLNNISGIQNVQVQIPRLSSPLNASSATNIQAHPTGLIFSVAVTTSTTTCTSASQQANSIATSSLGSNASAVVINTAPGATSPVLPLPIAQLVASGVKGLTQQGLRVSSPNTVSLAQAGKSVQLVGALPRASQLTGVKQTLTSRGLLQAQRMANATLKMSTSNATTAQMANSALAGNVASNSIVTLAQQQQLQLTLQKQAQFQQYHHTLTQQQLQNCLSQQQQKTISPAAVATKHHRRSNAADPNK